MASPTTTIVADSLAETFTSPAGALTVEDLLMWASIELAIELTTIAPAPAVPLELPAPAKPTPTRIGLEVARTFTGPVVAVMLEPSMAALMLLLTRLPLIEPPTPLPELATAMAPAIETNVVLSTAITVTPVARVSVELLIWALMLLLMMLTPNEPPTVESLPAVPELPAAPPTTTPPIFAFSSASTRTAPAERKVDVSIVAATVLVTTLMPMPTPAAPLLPTAMPPTTWKMRERSLAKTVISPFDVFVVVRFVMLEVTELLTTLTAIAPATAPLLVAPFSEEAPIDAVTPMISASDSAFTVTGPVWLKFDTVSMLASVVLLMTANDRPTPYAPPPPMETPPPTITRLVSSVALTTVSPVMVALPMRAIRAIVL